MGAHATSISQKLRALRVEFLEQAIERSADLRAKVDHLIQNGNDEGTLEHIARGAHQLAGTAGSFGYLEVTELSRGIDEDIRQLIAEGVEPTRSLLDSWRMALEAIHATFWHDQTARTTVPPTKFAKVANDVARLELAPRAAASILSVEDDPIQVAWLRNVFEARGYVFHNCARVSEFEHCFRSLAPDLLLLDASLPDGTGYALAESLRASRLHTTLPIVFLTAARESQDRLRALGVGADEWLTKPVDASLLLGAIEGRIARARVTRTLVERDGLTGLLNRAAFVERAESCVSRLRRERQARAALAVLDVDRFKAVNDSHGHSVGDTVLRELARSIRAQLRCSDLAGGIGGEEFAVLLEGARIEEAYRVCARLLARFRAVTHHATNQSPFHATFSVGIAPFALSSGDFGCWFEHADRALYQAKATGRNRVVVARNPLRVFEETQS